MDNYFYEEAMKRAEVRNEKIARTLRDGMDWNDKRINKFLNPLEYLNEPDKNFDR